MCVCVCVSPKILSSEPGVRMSSGANQRERESETDRQTDRGTDRDR